jgi:ankyrin repeat protein
VVYLFDTTSTQGNTALHIASARSRNDDASIVELLLANGADVSSCVALGATALDGAAVFGNLQCAKVLIAAGADVNRSSHGGLTSLHRAINRNHAAMVQLLLDNGATAVINSVIPTVCARGALCCIGRTALMMCTTADIVKLLLAAGADVHVVSTAGDTCLHVAVRHKLAVPLICLLIKAGVDLHAVNNEGKTAAQLAHEQHDELVEQLLNRAVQQQEH